MDYRETPPPPSLDGFVAAIWTLDVGGAPGDSVEHQAVPDGCIELIRRHTGRSLWRSEQPSLFVTGLALRPAALRFSGDARFTGIRLWPWGWHALGGDRCADFADDWRAVAEDSPLAALLTDDGAQLPGLIAAFSGHAQSPIDAIRHVDSVGALALGSGLAPRRLQRIFARETGMAPRSYLRLLRFREAVAGVQSDAPGLADTAAASGYADQAHMTREFRALGGLSPGTARRRAAGPFVPAPDEPPPDG
ncbi:helix-turn-helix domain-containing protein [Sphingomonas sp.]|jgi:AraC-like DNA-binding protein|uniref:AraC family transcriptional regulator n=1 Tax=Sphingomonas sp. TaxID=28214 RepID=UPI002E13556E|nr:helix-turn-helix domain-containing protein [Sphingomonas sp.]